MRQAGEAAHHIVAFEAKAAAPARQILKRFKIDINGAANGVFLAEAEHGGIHTARYYNEVNTRLGQAKEASEALEILGHIRDEIKAGKFPP